MFANPGRWKPHPNSTYLALGVLGGAYRGKDLEEREALTHLVEARDGKWVGDKTVCRRVPLDHIVDEGSAGASGGAEMAEPPTCSVCLSRFETVVATIGYAEHQQRAVDYYNAIFGYEPNAGRAVQPPAGFHEDIGEQSDYSRRELEVSGRNDYETVTWAWLKKHFGKPVQLDEADFDRHFKSHRLYIEVRPALGSAWQDHLSQEFTPDGLNDAKRYAGELLTDGLADAVWIEGVVEKYWHGVRGRPGREGRRVITLARWERGSAGMQENSIGYYVWVLRGDTPLDEGPYGPYDLDGAKAFARISATEGQHDRAVSLGRSADAASFEFVRRYRAHTGERLL